MKKVKSEIDMQVC